MRIAKQFLTALVPALFIVSKPVTMQAEPASERLEAAASVFSEIMAVPEKGIPNELLDHAHCVVIIPDVKKVALGIGGKYGRGFAICRQKDGTGWGAPAAVRVEGGSVGWQIGAKSTDVVMLVMNERGMKRLLESKFTLGGEASVAAGPVGRSASARTGLQMTAEILSWSKSQGVFAGLSLSGATLRNDLDENKELYGKPLTNKEVLMGGVAPPSSASKLIGLLDKYSHKEA